MACLPWQNLCPILLCEICELPLKDAARVVCGLLTYLQGGPIWSRWWTMIYLHDIEFRVYTILSHCRVLEVSGATLVYSPEWMSIL